MVSYKLIFTCLLLGQSFVSFAQPSGLSADYIITFKDKLKSSYSIDHPEEFLASRSIERRSRQGIKIVQGDLPITAMYRDSILGINGLTYKTSSKWFNNLVVHVSDTNIVAKIRDISFVFSVQPLPGSWNKALNQKEQKLEVEGSEVPKSTDLLYGASRNQVEMINGNFLHTLEYTGKNILIAVIDAGYSGYPEMEVFKHIREEGRLLGFYDFVDGDSTVFENSNHGTLVLSAMAANLPGVLVGTAPAASYLLLRSEDGDSEDIIEEYFWVAAAEYADSAGADVVNTSLGYTTFDKEEQNHSYEDMNGRTTYITRGADLAASKGMLMVNSAGNSGNGTWRYIGAPADGDSVLAIGAVGSDGIYAAFSSKGPSFDQRVKPNVATQGALTALAAIEGGTVEGNGTSFSGPVLSGMAACLWQAHPEVSNMELFKAIERSASQYHSPDELIGYGIPNFALAHLQLLNLPQNDQNEDALITISPNPFKELTYLYFNLVTEKQVEVTLFDVAGKEVFHQQHGVKSKGEQLILLKNLSQLGSGVYLLHLELGEQVIVQKLVKQ